MSFTNSPPAHISTLRAFYQADPPRPAATIPAPAADHIRFDQPYVPVSGSVVPQKYAGYWVNFAENTRPVQCQQHTVITPFDKTPLYHPQYRESLAPKSREQPCFAADALELDARTKIYPQRYQKSLDLPKEHYIQKNNGYLSHTDIFQPDSQTDVRYFAISSRIGKSTPQKKYGQSRKNEGNFSTAMLSNTWGYPDSAPAAASKPNRGSGAAALAKYE